MAQRFRTVVAVAAVFLLPGFLTATAFADDPTPKATLHYVEAPLNRPPGGKKIEVAKSSEPTETTVSPAPQGGEATADSPSGSTEESVELAKTGGRRDIWMTGFSLVCIWVGAAVVTYGRERNLKR
ncbi:hypothetical protein [Varibaculum vaginae]|uniref:hypothetical protein n=1 Tax=Varibaculum vaginae TaxID=2364797 RepID=UPI000F093CFA|nr:hypothetical protein [Varibaculum vaginae]